MSQSLMVYPNSDFLHMAPMLDDNVAKLINAEQMENYLASASTSPVQDYILSPSSYQPQQEQQNQRQLQLQFPATTVIPHSAPNSPPYAIVKTEEVPSQNPVDYQLMFPPTFDTTTAQDQQILPSQQRSYANVSLMQQRQQHQQQQQQHAQQLRMQHQLQQQIMYDPTPNHSTVTSSMMSSMVSAATSSSLFVPTAITTSAPFFHAPTLAQDDVSLFQRRPTYPAAHPAAPKRKLEEPVSPQLTAESDEPTSPSTSTRPSTSSRFDKVKPSRSTKVTKSSAPSSPVSFSPLTDASESKARATGKKAMAIKKAIIESRESSEQPENNLESSTYRAPGSGNVTHPRRAAQNRAAQRTFRNRRKAYIKELEQKVSEIDRTREYMEAVQAENQEVWRRLQVLEALAARSGLQVPVFPPLTSLAATATLPGTDGTSVSVVAGNEYGLAITTDNSDMIMMNHQYGSSDDE